MAPQRIEQVQTIDEVVLVVFRRLLHRFADEGKRGIVHHRFDTAFDQHLVEPFAFRQVADNEPLRRHRRPMAEAEIVIDPDIVPMRQQQLDGVTADITRAAGDENVHELGTRNSELGTRLQFHSALRVPRSELVGYALGDRQEHIFQIDFLFLEHLDTEAVLHQHLGEEAAVFDLVVERDAEDFAVGFQLNA